MGERCRCAHRHIGRVEIDQIARFSAVQHIAEIADAQFDIAQRSAHQPQILRVADQRILVVAEWCVELPLAIKPIQPIVTGTIEENRARRALDLAALRKIGLTIPVAHLKEIVWVEPVAVMPAQGSDQRFDIIADHFVADHQFGIVIAEHRPIAQQPVVEEVEKERPAADERLVVTAKTRRQTTRQFRD
jgi:hypothetical protein